MDEATRESPIGEKQAIKWLKQLTGILDLVHQKNYFHRDIKPENIMLRSSGQLVLVDFGAAREMTYTYLAQLGKSGGITRISSAGYTPPEQERGQAVPQSDFYALGCTFLYLLTGKLPTDSSIYDSLNNELHWREFAPQVSAPLADLIDRMIAPRANDRPRNTEEILAALARLDPDSPHQQVTHLGGLFPPNAFTLPQSNSLPGNPSSHPSGNLRGQPSGNPSYPGMGSSHLSHPSAPGIVPSHPSYSGIESSNPFTSQTQVQGRSFKKAWLWGGAIGLLLALGGGYGVWRSGVMNLSQAPAIEKISILRTLEGHSSYVNCLAITPDGGTVISGSADNTIKLWNFATGKELRTLIGHTSFVNALAISPDGQILVSGSADRTIKAWNLATGEEIRTLTGHTGFINTLAISPDGRILVSGGADQVIKVWELATGQELRTLIGHTGFVNALAISPDGQILVSGSADRTIKAWDLTTGREIRTLTGHTGFVNSLAINGDGQTVISASADKTIKVWDLATGRELRTLGGNTGFVNHIFLNVDGQVLVSGGTDRMIKIWNPTTGELRHTLTGYVSELKYFVISPDWRTIATGSGSKDIRIWQLPE